jgi:hypothetical protein
MSFNVVHKLIKLRKYLNIPTPIEPVSPDCRFSCYTTWVKWLDYRESDGNVMLIRDLVPIVDMSNYLKIAKIFKYLNIYSYLNSYLNSYLKIAT